MRILVTGVTGQVGGALLSRLRDLGTTVAADRTVIDLAQPDTIRGVLDSLASKLAGEDAIRAAGGSFLIIRTSWVYAAVGTNFLRSIAFRARESRELRVVADQIGTPTSAAIIADVVANMLAYGVDVFRTKCLNANGLVHLAASGEISWHGFAAAIIDGLSARNVVLIVEHVRPIRSEDYPSRAQRPRNSRLDLMRLHDVFGITTPWRDALAPELDQLARDLRTATPVQTA